MATNSDEMVVTPWEVSGKIDYDKLIREFGTQPLTLEILERIKKHTGTLHPQLQRRIFFSHRDMDWILQRYEAGEKFVLYTGGGHRALYISVIWFLGYSRNICRTSSTRNSTSR